MGSGGQLSAAFLPGSFHCDDLYMTDDETEACKGQVGSSRPPSLCEEAGPFCLHCWLQDHLDENNHLFNEDAEEEELFSQEMKTLPSLETCPRLGSEAFSLALQPPQVRLGNHPRFPGGESITKRVEAHCMAVWD